MKNCTFLENTTVRAYDLASDEPTDKIFFLKGETVNVLFMGEEYRTDDEDDYLLIQFQSHYDSNDFVERAVPVDAFEGLNVILEDIKD